MDNKYDYEKDIKALEALVKEVEDPSTSLDAIDDAIKESEILIKRCREYLTKTKEKLEGIDEL